MRLRGFWIMNNFEPKYIKISSKYLQKKLQELNVEQKKFNNLKLKNKKDSPLHKILHGIFN